MKLRHIVIGAISAAAVIAVVGIVISFLPTKSGHSVAQTVFTAPQSKTVASAGSPGQSFRQEFVSPTPTPHPSTGTGKQDNSLLVGSGGSSETIPTATPTPYRLHPTPPPAIVTASDVAAAAPNSKVTSKSVRSSHGTTQVVLSATTTTKPNATVSYYQSVFTSLGMTGKPIAAVGGSTSIAFSRGSSTVTITVSAHDKGSTYLIHGVLRTGA